MSDDDPRVSVAERAREKARRIAALDPKNLAKQSPRAIEAVIHDLQVHQIELEMQNEELVRTQEELDDARVRYFDLFQRAPIGYLTIDREGLVRAVNIVGAQLLADSPYGIVGRPLTRHVHPLDQDQLYHLRRRLAEGAGGRQICELRITRGKAVPRWVRVEAVNVLDEDGTSVTRLALSDIDAEKHAQDLIAESEDRFRRLAASTLDFVFTLDTRRLVTATFGRGAQQDDHRAVTIGQTRGHASSPAIATLHEDAENRALSGVDVVYEYAEIHATDAPRHYQTSLSPLRSAAGNITGVVGITRDLTAQVELTEAQTRAATLSNLTTVTGRIAHEINTPLQYLVLSLQLLQESMAPVEQLVARAHGAPTDLPAGPPTAEDAQVVAEFSDTLETALHGVRRIADTVRLMRAASAPAQVPAAEADLADYFSRALTRTRDDPPQG